MKCECHLPGFTELEREDRVALFKQGSFEVIVTRYTRLFTNEGMFTPDMTVLIPRSDFNTPSLCVFHIAYHHRHHVYFRQQGPYDRKTTHSEMKTNKNTHCMYFFTYGSLTLRSDELTQISKSFPP